MPRQVKTPDRRVHQFPDAATDDEISDALAGIYQRETPPAESPSPAPRGMFSRSTPEDFPVVNVAKGAWNIASVIPEAIKQAVTDPIGTVQGIGGVLYEELAYDENGQFMTGTFMDYTMPTAKEAPPIAVYHQETPSPFTPLGTKGAGESAISAPFGALVSAVEDALSPFGLVLNETPLTPNRMWRWIQEAKARKAA